MQITPTSHMSFNISINGNIAFLNENIFFTVRFVQSWNDPEFFSQLEKMDVCTTIIIEDKNISIFKN